MVINNIAGESKKPPKDQLQALVKLFTQREFENALALGNELERKFSGSPELQNILGAINAEIGKFDRAIGCYQKAVRIRPDYAEAYNNMGVALKATDQIILAVESYEKAIMAKPEYAGAYNNLGNILADKGDAQAASDKYRQALAIDPNFASAHNNLGLMSQALDDHKSAILSFRNAIRLRPQFAEAHSNLGNTLQQLGRLDEAEASFNQAIALKPAYAAAHYNLGNVLRNLNKLNDAVGCYQIATSLNPDYFEAHCNLGITLGELGKLIEATVCFRKVIMLKPEYVNAHSQLGGILNRLGKANEAESSYRHALSLEPSDSETNHNFGIMLFENGKYEEAAKHFKMCGNSISESYVLRCFYLQDEMTKFYKQLDKLIGEKVCNAMIGSFACRAKLRYGIETPNPFCEDPLKYVVKIDLNRVSNFDKTFVANCKSILNDKTTPYRNQNLIANGNQTAGNLLAISGGSLGEVEKIIRREVNNYRCEFLESTEGMFLNWPTDYSINCWLVSMKSGGELAAHIHEAGWISGSIYINVPAKSQTDSGNLVVCIDNEKFQSGEAGGENIDVFTGAMCLFPSSLLHYTIPFESEGERIVLAFDIVPKALDS